jgi:hypothetical protein
MALDLDLAHGVGCELMHGAGLDLVYGVGFELMHGAGLRRMVLTLS